MTLKPNYPMGFAKTAAWFSGIIFVVSGAIPLLSGEPIDWTNIVSIALFCGVFLGGGVCVMFTPREISWDEEKISLRVNFPRSGVYSWQQLEAYSSWNGRLTAFLLKFKGMQAYQIVPVCFSRDDWQSFQSFLRTHFPDKKTTVWFGPIPVRLRRK